MPGLGVNAGPLLSGSGATIGREFWDTYSQKFEGEKKFVDMVSNPDIPSKVKNQPEGYFETSAYPVIWLDGDDIASKPFSSVQFVIYNRSWGRRIPYSEDDLVYEQTGSLLAKVREAAGHWNTLDARILIQFMTAATDPDLVPGTILAPDGAAMYATTAGGANRFGVSNGNSISGDYMDSAATVLDGIQAAINQATQFLDTEGQPLLDPTVFMEMVIAWPAAYATVFQQAMAQTTTSIGPNTGTSNAGVTNYILNSGRIIHAWITPRLTAKAFYVFFPRVNKQSFGKAVVTPLREAYADMTNDPTARSSKQFYNQWDMRFGPYLGPCFSTVKVTDS